MRAPVSSTKGTDARDRLRTFIDDHLRPAGVLADPVGDVMTERPATCGPRDSLERVAELMWNHDCGIVPVTDEADRLLGIVTDRDICIATYTRGVAPASATVATTMARDVHSCGPQQSLADVLDLMAEQQVHRVPVTSAADGRLLGIVSLGDIARYVDGALPFEATLAARARVVRALAAISRPRAEGEAAAE
jgi:CBS domain-containing protein